MKKAYVKPVMESEEFVANEYVAACWKLTCQAGYWGGYSNHENCKGDYIKVQGDTLTDVDGVYKWSSASGYYTYYGSIGGVNNGILDPHIVTAEQLESSNAS